MDRYFTTAIFSSKNNQWKALKKQTARYWRCHLLIKRGFLKKDTPVIISDLYYSPVKAVGDVYRRIAGFLPAAKGDNWHPCAEGGSDWNNASTIVPIKHNLQQIRYLLCFFFHWCHVKVYLQHPSIVSLQARMYYTLPEIYLLQHSITPMLSKKTIYYQPPPLSTCSLVLFWYIDLLTSI